MSQLPSQNDREFDLLKKIARNTAEIADNPGGGGSVAIKDEGSTIVAAATSINFKGSAVTVTDAGGGQADVDISGGSGSPGGSNGQIQYNNAGAFGGLDSTGTGKVAREDSPAFTGTPTAPTAAPGTANTTLASTAFVAAAITASAYIDGQVDTYSDLPITVGTPPLDSAYLVTNPEGLWLINRKPAGVYFRTGNTGALSDWTYGGIVPDAFSDANFEIYNSSDSSKILKFDLSGIVGTRTLTVPNASGTIALFSDITKANAGLSNVTDDVQTKAAIVPNTVPSSGQILVGNAGATAYEPKTVSGDATLASTGAITIANDAVTYAKMQNISATSRVLGRKSASAGDTEECTLSEILDFIGSASHGDILYRGASAWARLAAGTSGQFLKTNGAGANPEWANGGGGWTSGVLFRIPASTQIINNSTTETSCFSGAASISVPGGTLGTTGVIKFCIAGQLTNSSGANVTLTVRVKFGGVTYYQDPTANIASNANPRAWKIEGELSADNATGAQRLTARMSIGPAGTATTGYGDLGSAAGVISDNNFGGTPAEDSTANKDFDVTLTASINTFSVTVHSAYVAKV